MRITIAVIIILIAGSNLLANEIDSLKTDRDIENYIHQHNNKLKDFSIDSIQKHYYPKLQKKLADSFEVKSWQKVDFDGNGLTDLFVYGFYYGRSFPVALIDEAKVITFHYFSKTYFEETLFPVIKTIDNQVFLILYISCTICKRNENYIKRVDTLIYKFGKFIEPNFNVLTHQIEKIEYSTSLCFGTCPKFTLEINSNRKAIYNASDYNEKKGKFRTKIDSISYSSIVKLINYIDVPKLQDEYRVNCTDQQTCVLKIIYDNGKTKQITDYGKVGTYGLSMIYNKLFNLRYNQHWRKR